MVAVGVECDLSAVVREGRRFPTRYLYILVGRRGMAVRARGQSGVVEEAHGAETITENGRDNRSCQSRESLGWPDKEHGARDKELEVDSRYYSSTLD